MSMQDSYEPAMITLSCIPSELMRNTNLVPIPSAISFSHLLAKMASLITFRGLKNAGRLAKLLSSPAKVRP